MVPKASGHGAEARGWRGAGGGGVCAAGGVLGQAGRDLGWVGKRLPVQGF